MAVETYYSAQVADEYRSLPVEDHGKMRIQYFSVAAVVVAGDANSILELCDLPPGRCRVLPNMSRFNISALGASRVMTFGHRAYDKRSPSLGTTVSQEAQDVTAFNSAAVSVASALEAAVLGQKLKYDIYSVAGVRLIAQVTGGTYPIGATLSGFFTYIYE